MSLRGWVGLDVLDELLDDGLGNCMSGLVSPLHEKCRRTSLSVLDDPGTEASSHNGRAGCLLLDSRLLLVSYIGNNGLQSQHTPTSSMTDAEILEERPTFKCS